MKKNKKIISLALALTLSMSAVYGGGFTIFAEDGLQELKYENNNPEDEVLNNNPDYFPASDTNNTMNWKLSETFSDEFNDNTLNTERWHDMHQYWVGRAPAYYNTENIHFKDGVLLLRSDWTGEYLDAPDGAAALAGDPIMTASVIQSKLKSGYGYYEIKSRTAPISLTSAFWLQGKTKEVDVYEQLGRAKKGHEPDEFPINTHDFAGGWDNDLTTPFKYKTGIDLTVDFHTYGFEWGPDWLKFYFDGELVHAMENVKFYESMNIFADTEAFRWNGYPEEEDFFFDDDGRFSGDFEVDYIRVWRSDEPQNDDVPVVKMPEAKLGKSNYGTPATNSGAVDAAWNNANELTNFGIVSGGLEKFKATSEIKTLWDEDNFYILVEVLDNDVFINETNLWNGDCIDLYFDMGNEKTTEGYDPNDFSVKIIPDGRVVPHANAPSGITCDVLDNDKGYTLQISVPWKGFDPTKNAIFGFDAQVNEGSSDAGERVAIALWSSKTGDVWQSTLTSGNIMLSKDEVKVFSDVPSDNPYLNAINGVVDAGLFLGVSSTEFAPNSDVTYGMALNVLYRNNGGGNVIGGDNWFKPGENWATENSILDEVNVHEKITRENLALAIFRSMSSSQMAEALTDLNDADSVSSNCKDAVSWAVKNGVITAVDGNFNPSNLVSRGEFAEIIMNLNAL